MKTVVNKLVDVYHNLISRYWEIGIASFSEDVIDENFSPDIRWIKNPYSNETWFADPFILSENEKEFIVLVEEYPFLKRKGQISRLIVSKEKWEITDVKVLLELDTHLSFPCYIQKDGKTYIYPENSASETSTIYEYDYQQENLTPVGILNENPLTDAVVYEIDGYRFLLSTQHPFENKNTLNIYRMDGLRSDKDPIQTIAFNENIARNAGIPFMAKGKLIRPAQICNTGYGEGMLLQEVMFKDCLFGFKNLRRMFSPLKRCPLAFHTMNVFDNRYVIFDAQGYRHSLLGPMIDDFAAITKKVIRR